LIAVGLSQNEVAGVMGDNWLRFYETNFGSGK
jgi:microsomal dipeptidase-like Zn-dependent dipeptidase